MRALIGPLVIIGLIVGAWMLFSGGAPAGMSEPRYERYQQTPAPKVLYSCTRRPSDAALLEKLRECSRTGRSGCEQGADEARKAGTRTDVEFVGGSESGTYREMLERARRNCESSMDNKTSGEFKVLESVEK